MLQERLTVFIGRFSPFHLGHEEVLLRALKSSEVVLLLIGSAYTARNVKNPFTAAERADIVTCWYSEEVRKAKQPLGKLVIKPLADYPSNDQAWIASVQEAVESTRDAWSIPKSWPNFLTGAERDASTWYLKIFGSYFKQDFISESQVGFDWSATKLRDDYFKGGNAWEYKTPMETIQFLDSFKQSQYYSDLVEEYKFLEGYKKAWAAAPYAPTFVTVDACVIQSGHVLLVTRAAQPGKGLLALPGGFLEQDEKLVDGAVRELIEETSIELSKRQLYGSITDKEIFDNPGRSLRGRTITTCFLFKLEDSFALPKIKPQKGEALRVRWVPIAEAKADPSLWFEDHYDIFMTMYARITK